MTIETIPPANASIPRQFMHDALLIVNGSTAKPEPENKPAPFPDEFELIENLIAAWKVENSRRGGKRNDALLGWRSARGFRQPLSSLVRKLVLR